MKKNNSPLAQWMFYIFTAAVTIINAALTFVFSRNYLPAAFGDPNGMIAPWLAAIYGLIIMDAAYMIWFWVYLRVAESTKQRTLALSMSIISLIASTAATVTQLAVNSYGLVDLSQYTESIGLTALSFMLVVTALHIISFAAYVLMDPEEEVKSKAAKLKGEMIDAALAKVEDRINKQDAEEVAELMSGVMRRQVLHQLGFTENLNMVTALPEGEAPSGNPKLAEPQNEVVIEAPAETQCIQTGVRLALRGRS